MPEVADEKTTHERVTGLAALGAKSVMGTVFVHCADVGGGVRPLIGCIAKRKNLYPYSEYGIGGACMFPCPAKTLAITELAAEEYVSKYETNGDVSKMEDADAPSCDGGSSLPGSEEVPEIHEMGNEGDTEEN